MYKELVPGESSPEYMDWITSRECKKVFGENPKLTKTQHSFAEWYFLNGDILQQTGNLDSVFISIHSYLKHQ